MTGEGADRSRRRSRSALAPSVVGELGRRAARKRLLTTRGHPRRDIADGHLRGYVADAAGAGEIEIGDVAQEVLAAVFGGGPPAARTERRAVP